MKKMKLPDLKIYKNSSTIPNFEFPLNLSDIIKISLLGKLNTLLIGERGEGKTKLLEEINSLYFSEKGIYIRARPDMKLREIFEKFNIEKMSVELKEIKTSPFTMIDEINRAPSIIQNEFFHILDGYIEFENKKIYLGNGYHVVFATANYEREGIVSRYHGIFEMDASILDRFGVIINTDLFPPSPLDTIEIVNSFYEEIKGDDYSQYFKEKFKEIKKVPLSIDAIILVLYLRYGLDYCEKNIMNSKKVFVSNIPLICEGCHKLGNGCGYIFTPSMRFLKSMVLFSKARIFYLNTKGLKKEMVEYNDLLEDFSFLSPFNGIISSHFIYEKYSGDFLKAGIELKNRIKREIEDKKEKIKEIIISSLKGKIYEEYFKEMDGEWQFLRKVFQSVYEIAKKEGDLLKMMEKSRVKFEKIAENYKNPFLLFILRNG
jgi:energy-coupling factor transporter ATP-binding protein EcfA2